MSPWRWLLLPLSVLYGAGASIRNIFYDKKILASHAFPVPIIAIGNLSTGGSGKSPMAEYLVRLFEPDVKVAVVSRGYGRKTKGFRLVQEFSTALESGDEPLQIRRKFPDTLVAVSESRALGIRQVLKVQPETNLVILDDAFQHRTVNVDINILLIPYSEVFTANLPLPAGSLREWKSGMKRADVIIISKCPKIFSPIEQRRISSRLSALPHQQVFYSYINYGEMLPAADKGHSPFGKDYFFSRSYSALVFTGIANPEPLLDYLSQHLDKVEHAPFPDHHRFSAADMEEITKKFDTIVKKNKIIITTEKDLVRMRQTEAESFLMSKPVFYIPVETGFHHTSTPDFDTYIKSRINALNT